MRFVAPFDTVILCDRSTGGFGQGNRLCVAAFTVDGFDIDPGKRAVAIRHADSLSKGRAERFRKNGRNFVSR
ncbi:hypothetical protein AA103196_2800 [Ameyamaea chiangmaiensis NBRC 103196]|nr:hypothetical protein AA103196_2800 [Ameyamaea chiangmaiensis NBRC 103196]